MFQLIDFTSALRGLGCPLLLPLFDMKQHSLSFQALTARYEVQSQWEGLIIKRSQHMYSKVQTDESKK